MNFDQILEFIRSQNVLIVYMVLMIGAFIESIFPPFPGDMVTLAGAFVAGEGNISYMGVFVSVSSGGLFGIMILYYVGRIKGRAFLEKRAGRYLGRTSLLKVESLFHRSGDAIILFHRFMAGIRSVIAIAAGIGGVKPIRMIVLALIGNLLWNAFLVGLMIYTKSNWKLIIEIVKKYHLALIAVGVIIFALWVLKKIWVKRRD